MPKSATVHQLKVTLKHVKPPVWRRLEVPSDIKMDKLHLALQRAFGWTNSHLHQFVVGGACYGLRDPDGDNADMLDERRYRLAQLADNGARFTYEYDFGDDWGHEVRVEKLLPADAGVRYPRCTAGARACPPEDCGGPGGYADLLAALADPAHARHQELLEWSGGPIDAEHFDLADADRSVRARS
jgi:Plasmid pRiA4b ORF-3-like protein